MRNLEILTKFADTLNLSDGDDKVVRACTDEFGKFIFVYTAKHLLIRVKYD